MKRVLDELLKALPERVPRSRLEPYSQLIEELRRQERTFREIAEILDTQCGVHVTRSGVHDFLRTRAATRSREPKPLQRTKVDSDSTETLRRIKELKSQQPYAIPTPDDFQFEPNEPLRISTSMPRLKNK